MSNHRACTCPHPVVEFPFEEVLEGSEEERRVGNSTSDYDISILLQSLNYALGAQVSVGTDHRLFEVLK